MLTGANGFGKTTLIDAIEWCLTGDISRVKTCYGERNTSQSEKERAENKKGIIKNYESGQEDFVKVMLTLKVDDIEVNIYREQKEDSLYTESELKFVQETPEYVKNKIKQFAANDKFYTYHVLDMYKSYNFLNYDRKEMKKQFEDFIKPHPIADSLSQKLLEFQNEIETRINNLNAIQISSSKQIVNEEGELESLKNDLKIIDYPQTKFYEKENLNIYKEEVENVKQQFVCIKACGYNIVDIKIKDVISYYEAREKSKKISELTSIINSKESDLNIVIKNSYYNMIGSQKVIP